MSILIPVLALVSLFNFGMGLAVLSRGPGKITHLAFFGMCLSFVVWGIAIALMFETENTWFARMTFAAGIGMGYFLVLFTSNFPRRLGYPRWLMVIAPFIGLVFLPFTFNDIILVQYKPLIIGPLFIPYMVWIGSFFTWGFGNLVAQFFHFKDSDIERRQVFFMFLGLTIMLILAFITNGILPVLEGAANYVQYSPIFSVAFIACTSIALLRYHLFDFKVLATETLVTVLSSILLIEIFTARSTVETVGRAILFAGVTLIGILLVRSVQKEVQRSEELASLTIQLTESNEKLKQLDAMKTEFLSIASHQLRTPLAAIRGYVDLMLEGAYGKANKKQVEVVNKIHETLESLIELVAQLLSVSRIESGRTVVTIEPVDLQPICDSVTSLLSLKASERNLILNCEVKRMALVLGDASKVKEVMMNLVENALKYTEKGSVGIYFFDEPQYVRVEIRDTGIGLEKASIEKLFQKFSRVSNSTSSQPGTGLGLYVCRRLVEAMGGEVWVESKGLGKGSVFSFRLKKAPVIEKSPKT